MIKILSKIKAKRQQGILLALKNAVNRHLYHLQLTHGICTGNHDDGERSGLLKAATMIQRVRRICINEDELHVEEQ